MGWRASRIVAGIRDAAVTAVSVVLMGTSYGKWNPSPGGGEGEPAHLVLFGIAALIALLSLVDAAFLAAKAKGKAHFYFNSSFQLVLDFFVAGLFPPAGVPLFVANALVLVLFKREKSAPAPPPPAYYRCTCSAQLAYSEKRKRWYCPACKTWAK